MIRADGMIFLAKGEKPPAPERPRITLTPAEIDDAYDYPLTWREALKRIYGVVKSRDTFKRLRTDGAVINGQRIKLGTVRRPNGHVARVSDVEAFIAACQRADEGGHQTTREYHQEPGQPASAERPESVEAPARHGSCRNPGGRASIARKGDGYLPGPQGRTHDVGRRLDVTA